MNHNGNMNVAELLRKYYFNYIEFVTPQYNLMFNNSKP